ncbi:hypothetical protein K457DRAFT_137637 [Linnemannia elongata AG-77]|uniref:Uncharacterized protein n=1 Tax=Linnemannia elongata AG-77 TaxID=1314771 RepID=A0A197JXT6_9FUNG|nr:hypothetical protein K457DRAFT_137637 [Linnemannia elongata AG-77]
MAAYISIQHRQTIPLQSTIGTRIRGVIMLFSLYRPTDGRNRDLGLTQGVMKGWKKGRLQPTVDRFGTHRLSATNGSSFYPSSVQKGEGRSGGLLLVQDSQLCDILSYHEQTACLYCARLIRSTQKLRRMKPAPEQGSG